ncbi:hypothetical protein ES703_32512 [subsurface metagenome]
MALVKYGAGIVQMSGSIAGDVHARNRFGNYKRPRTKPVNPKSPRQTAARTVMMYLAEQWRESPMTTVIRDAWQTYADSVNWNNRLGEQVTLTGFNMFIRGNAALANIGADIIYAGPTDLGLPAGDPAMVVSNVSEAAQQFDLAFDDGFDWCAEDDAYMIMYQGKPVSASHNFFGGPFRRCAFIAGDTAVPTVSPKPGLPNIGFPILEGQKIWWEAAIVRADGRISTRFRCPPTIAVA